MAIVVGTVTTGYTLASSITFSHTVADGSDRFLFVGVEFCLDDGPSQVNSITYAGVSLVKKGSSSHSGDCRSEIWYLVAPVVGTANIVVTFDAAASLGAVAGAIDFSGVHQTVPLGTFAAANGVSSTPTVNVTSASGELVEDSCAAHDRTLTAVGGGQTQDWNVGLVEDISGGASHENGAATVTMSWTMSGSDDWATCAVSVKPASSAEEFPFYARKRTDILLRI
jgi:hypothetical protein